MSTKRTKIILTGHRPVSIIKEDWPVLAEAVKKYSYDDHNKPLGILTSTQQPYSTTTWILRVRYNTDNRRFRCIIYAMFLYKQSASEEKDYEIRCGELLDKREDNAKSLPEAIARVGTTIESRIIKALNTLAVLRASEVRSFSGKFPTLIHDCIANLPAVEL